MVHLDLKTALLVTVSLNSGAGVQGTNMSWGLPPPGIFHRGGGGEAAVASTRSTPMLAELYAELRLLFLAKKDRKCFDLGLTRFAVCAVTVGWARAPSYHTAVM